MAEKEFKVAVLPCNGIGRLSSTIIRQAGYRLAELRPDQVVLLSVNALTVQEADEMAKIKQYPVLVIDACRPHCASALIKELGITPAVSLYVPDVAAEKKIPLAGEKRRKLGKRGQDLAEAVAQKAAEAVDRIVADEMLSTL